jgi:pyruvate oxidase
VLGDVEATCTALLEGLHGVEVSASERTGEVAARWALWREEKADRSRDDLGRGLNAAVLFAALGDAVPDDAVITVDVGNNAYSFGRYFECVDQDILMSGYLGSIGFALPAAMGAWAAVGDKRAIVSISGDGGFGQYAMELTTAVKYGMNLTHVLVNNAELGKISKEQRAGLFDVWQTSLHNPNFADFATNCGALGIRVETVAELPAALAVAIAHDGPALVEVMSDVDLL